jgi:hypothetical protein
MTILIRLVDAKVINKHGLINMAVIQTGSDINKKLTVFAQYNCRFVTARGNSGDRGLNIEGNYVIALNWHNP